METDFGTAVNINKNNGKSLENWIWDAACSIRGAKDAAKYKEFNLHFDSGLLSLDRKLGDYVIVHELLHSSVPNHGKLWKSLMRAHLGDYERMETRLRKLS